MNTETRTITRRSQSLGYASTELPKPTWNTDRSSVSLDGHTPSQPVHKALTPRQVIRKIYEDSRRYTEGNWSSAYFLGGKRIIKTGDGSPVREALQNLVNGDIEKVQVEIEAD